MRFFGLYLLLSVSVVVSSSEDDVDLEKRKYNPYPVPEGGTDPAAFDVHPVVVNARRMAHLLQLQDVVSTCRFILFKEWKTFIDAKDSCDNIVWPFTHRGVGIASIHNEDHNTEIRHLLQIAFGLKRVTSPYHRDNWVWIGLTKRLNNDHKLPKSEAGIYNQSEWWWSDGDEPATAYTYSNWARKMPDQQYSKKFKEYQLWVMVNKRGHWDDTYASMKAPYACNYCGKYIVIAEQVSWEHAKAICNSYFLLFAIVDSQRDNDEMAWASNITFGPEVHPRRWDHINWIWLGTREVMDNSTGVGTGEWFHEETGNQLGWNPIWDWKRQPDNRISPKHGEQSVVAFSRINTKWDDSFKSHKRPFACMCPSRACHYAEDYSP